MLDVDVTRGIATVDLSGEVLEQMPRTDPPLAIAQLVLTLTRFQGIGQVLFTRDGVPIDVPLPPNDELSPARRTGGLRGLRDPARREPERDDDHHHHHVAPPDTEPPAATDGPVDTGP